MSGAKERHPECRGGHLCVIQATLFSSFFSLGAPAWLPPPLQLWFGRPSTEKNPPLSPFLATHIFMMIKFTQREATPGSGFSHSWRNLNIRNAYFVRWDSTRGCNKLARTRMKAQIQFYTHFMKVDDSGFPAPVLPWEFWASRTPFLRPSVPLRLAGWLAWHHASPPTSGFMGEEKENSQKFAGR